MPAVVYVQPWDVRRRLAELGLTVEALTKAVQAGHTARVLCSPNDPPFIPGTEAWRFTLRTLRDELLREGHWRKDDLGNYSIVINDKLKFNIVVASGDTFTGINHPYREPRTRSPKGLYTEAATQMNIRQGDLFPESLPDSVVRKAMALEYPTWILLIYVTDDEVRAELSFPKRFDEGEILEWKYRIIVPDIEADPGVIDASQDPGPDFDVPVRRKGRG